MNRFKHLLVHLDLQGAHDRSAVRYASAEKDLRGSARLAAVGGHLARIEHTLRAWPVTGAAWLLLIGVILLLLAVSRN